jgi:hypothetical protein
MANEHHGARNTQGSLKGLGIEPLLGIGGRYTQRKEDKADYKKPGEYALHIP